MTVIAISSEFHKWEIKDCYTWAKKQLRSFPDLFFLMVNGGEKFYVVRLSTKDDERKLGDSFASFTMRVTDDMRILTQDEMRVLTL